MKVNQRSFFLKIQNDWTGVTGQIVRVDGPFVYVRSDYDQKVYRGIFDQLIEI